MLSASTRSVIIHSVIAKRTLTLVLDEQPIFREPFHECRARHATKARQAFGRRPQQMRKS